jgi:hypothetical protein
MTQTDGSEVEVDEGDVVAAKPAPPAPALVTYYVRAGTKSGNGSSRRPFAQITAALDAARSVNATEVIVNVADGSYTGELTIDRRTTIRGASRATVLNGSITSALAYALTVEHLQIAPPRGKVGVRTSGFLYTHPTSDFQVYLSGTTALTDIRIVDAVPYGVEQVGGRLDLYMSEVAGTRAATAGDSFTGDGAALHATFGASAHVANTQLRNNAQGILADGYNTMVNAWGGLVVEDTIKTPTQPGRAAPASINVLDGAHFQAFAPQILRSRTLGIQVSAATARIDDAIITDLGPPSLIEPTTLLDARVAIALWNDARLEMVKPLITGPGFLGINVGYGAAATLRKSDGASNLTDYCLAHPSGCTLSVYLEWATLYGGWIRGYQIGSNEAGGIIVGGTPNFCHDVLYYENGINHTVESGLPLPPKPPGTETEPAAQTCTSVAYR